MNWQQIVDAIPEFVTYLTMDELRASTQQLKADYPELVHTEIIGRSRQGTPLDYIRIGNGKLNAVWLGGGHPNEPLGCLVLDYFTRLLCENDTLREELGYTWHFIKCLDPDGLRRNEAWLSQPFSLRNFSRHFYRPPVLMQPEFTFPYQYKTFSFDAPLPETEAILTVFEKAQPDFHYSLHCGSYGGAFYGVNEACPPLYQPLQDVMRKFNLYPLPYDLIVNDVGSDVHLAEGIFLHEGIQRRYEALAAQGVANPAQHIPHGGTGFEIAQQYGAFVLNAEVDYCQDAQVIDDTPTDIPLAQIISASMAFWASLLETIQVVLPAIGDLRVAFNLTLVPHLDLSMPAMPNELPPPDQLATVRRIHEFTEVPKLRVLREIGQLLGMLDDELVDGNPSHAIHHAHQLLTQQFETIWQNLDKTLDYHIVPLRELVGYQLGAGLVAAKYVRDERA